MTQKGIAAADPASCMQPTKREIGSHCWRPSANVLAAEQLCSCQL